MSEAKGTPITKLILLTHITQTFLSSTIPLTSHILSPSSSTFHEVVSLGVIYKLSGTVEISLTPRRYVCLLFCVQVLASTWLWLFGFSFYLPTNPNAIVSSESPTALLGCLLFIYTKYHPVKHPQLITILDNNYSEKMITTLTILSLPLTTRVRFGTEMMKMVMGFAIAYMFFTPPFSEHFARLNIPVWVGDLVYGFGGFVFYDSEGRGRSLNVDTDNDINFTQQQVNGNAGGLPAPIAQLPPPPAPVYEPEEHKIIQLCNMGFMRDDVIAILKETGGDVERCVDHLCR